MSQADRRVQRTHDALRRAMTELIIEKGFEAISVSEIADRANVGRSTFYVHFADKEDLLQGSLDQLRAWLEGRVRVALEMARDVRPALAFCLPMLEHADEQRLLFAAMIGTRGAVLVRELMHDIWVGLMRAHYPGDELVVQAIAGAFGSTLSWWLEKAPELTPSEVDRRFRIMARRALG